MDASDVEFIWNYLYRKYSFRGNSIAGAISAIDIALWDIKGKRFQAPVWDLLGGKARQKVRAIALQVRGANPDEAAASARRAKEAGYTALKFTPMPGEWWLKTFPTFIQGCEAMLAAVRDAVGWDFDIGVEIHRNMLPSDAIVFIQHAAKYLPYFIEDPIAPDSVVSMAEVSEKMNLPLAVGERNTGIWEFREYAQLTKCHFFKPDVGLAGGITHTRKIAAVAESHHIRIAPHNFLGPVATAACIQLATATPNWDVQEAYDEKTGARGAIVHEPVPVVDGYFIPPETPGIGVEFDEAAPARFPFEQPPAAPPIREDGSVGLR
jgi:galactonate dehydratase